jgi:alpha-2-macroglobulin
VLPEAHATISTESGPRLRTIARHADDDPPEDRDCRKLQAGSEVVSVIQRLIARILPYIQAIRRGCGAVARALVGEVDWRAPPWVRWTAGRLKGQTQATIGQIRQKPRQATLLAFITLTIISGTYFTYRWYESLPRPVETGFTVASPGITCYACEPAGKPDPLRIRFEASVAPLAMIDKDLDPKSENLQMSPPMKGTWHWDSDRTLRFQPAEDWPIAAHFKVSLNRRGLVATHVRLINYDLTFNTPDFQAKLGKTDFYQDPAVANDKKVVVAVTFSHPVDAERFEKRISLTLFERITDTLEKDRGKTPFTVIYDKQRLSAYIHSGQLAVPEKMGRLAIRIEPGLRAARGGHETESPLVANVSVPGLHSLEVNDVSLQIARNEREEPSQVLLISMNHSVLERDMPRNVHAWVLPTKNPDATRQAQFEQYNHGKPFRWSETSVSSDVLKVARPLRLTQVPGELEHYELHSFRHEAEPGEFVYIKIDKGLHSFGGYILDRSFEGVYEVPEYPSELRIAQQGSLLALSGDKALTVMTRGVATVHVEAGRLLPAQIQHLVTQTRGDFGAPVFNNYDFDASNITERFTDKIALPALKPGTAHYTAISLARFLSHDPTDHRGVFFMRVQAWDTEHDRPIGALEDTRLIVVTDLGLLAKKSLDGSQDVFVQSIHTGEPLAEVRIEVLGRNGLPVLTATSDAEGHAHFPDLSSFKREQEPVLYLAHRNGDASFLPIQDRGRGLDLSRFDVGGVENRVDEGALSAYLFCDRGLYRPGEEIHAGAIVRTQDWKRSLEGIPLLLQITDPRGVVLRHESFKPGAGGFSEIRQPTYVTWPAGTYTLSVWLLQPRGGNSLIGSTTVQVRDFLPDRLRMSTHFSTEQVDGWVSPDSLKANIDLQNLFGTPAAHRRVTAHMSLSPSFPTFKGYTGYQFYDPQTAHESFEEDLAAATTNEKGEAAFDLNLQRFARATYRLEVDTEGFEADGGRGVSSAATQLVSNAPYLVGWKADGGLEYVSRNARRAATFIAIDSHANMTEVAHLKLIRLEIRYVSTLIRQSNGTYQYESRRKEITVEEHETALPKSGLTLALPSTNPGNFAYVMTDGAGQKLARMEYHVAGEANLTRTMEKDAQLQISLARHDFSPGEDIEMQIQAPYTGAGLITIERERVYAWHWFHTTTTSSTQKIRLPAGIEGNAYVHVAFVRDPGSDEIYASPLSYGVQPFSINLDSHRNPVHLETAALVKPAQTLKIGYSTQQPARIVVFAVDEGILQVAGYHTPDPLMHFFQKRALAVTTTQILDLIMPELRRGELNDAAPGGDQGSAIARHLNPFHRKGDKPVVYWSTILHSDSTPRELEYKVPDYFDGTLRVMAVAVSDESIGVAESRTLVRGDFVLSPNAPTTVTPGDRFEVSVGIANDLEGSGADAKLIVKLKTDPSLQIEGDTSQAVAIPERHEGVAHFRIKTLEELGPANLTFSVTSGTASASRRIDLSVRPATPYMTSLAAGHMKQASKDIKLTRNLYPQFRTLEASTSRVPLSLAHGLVTYLANYPYVCTEQIVSQAMPALMLGDRPEFGYVRTEPGANIGGLVDELRVRQNDQGAYKLWPGSNTVIEFVSLYAQHFLLEAMDHGEAVPGNLVENGNAYLRAIAIRDGNNLADERDSAYAIYLLTRQGHVMSAEASALRKRLTDRYKGQWEQDITAAWLAASFKLMQQDRDAEKAIAPLRFTAGTGSDNFYNDSLTRDGFLLYVLSKYFPGRLQVMPPEALENIAMSIDANFFHSLSAATTLMGLSAYVTATHADTDPKLGISEILGHNQAPRALQLPAGLIPKVKFTADAKALRFTSGSDLSAFYLVNESGFDRTPPREAIVKGFEILREYTDDHGAPVKQVRMGDQVSVHLRFRAIQDHTTIAQVALEDLLPGGFELVIPQENSGICGFCTGGGGVSGLDFADPREDRVVFYTMLTSDVREIVYRIKATNIGTYVVPPAFGEAMYDRKLLARSVAGTIEVVQP